MKFEEVQIYYVLMPGEENERGPFSMNELCLQWRAGELPREALWAVQGMDKWSPMADLLDEIEGRKKRDGTSDSGVKATPPPMPPFVSGLWENFQRAAPSMAGSLEGLMQPVERPPKLPTKKYGPVATTLAVIAGCIGMVFIVASIAVMFDPNAGQDNNFDAYYTATEFVKKTYPGAREFSGFRQSAVEREGNVYRVALEVDGLNAFGGPVRKTVGLEMELDGSTWRLKRIEQK